MFYDTKQFKMSYKLNEFRESTNWNCNYSTQFQINASGITAGKWGFRKLQFRYISTGNISTRAQAVKYTNQIKKK